MELPRKVYAIQHNVTKRIYIGSSTNVDVRYWSHICLLRRGKHHIEDWQKDFDEYGEDFSLFILEEFQSYTSRRVEYEWMQKYRSYERGKGYNYKDPAIKRYKDHRLPLKTGLPEMMQPETEVATNG